MAQKKVTLNDWLQTGLIRLCRIHFVLLGAYAVYTIASDATHLITPQLVLQRWKVAAALLVGTSIIWYAARRRGVGTMYYRTLIYALILFDIGFAAFNIYTERGMASQAVVLFSIPIVVSAVLLSRAAIFMTAAISTAAYVLAAVKYFVDNFNEGYKAQLYIEVSFYCVTFFVLAMVLAVLVRFKNPEGDLGL